MRKLLGVTELLGGGLAFTYALLPTYLKVLIITVLLIGIAVYVFSAIQLMKLLKCCNHKMPWCAFVPLWNSYELAKLSTYTPNAISIFGFVVQPQLFRFWWLTPLLGVIVPVIGGLLSIAIRVILGGEQFKSLNKFVLGDTGDSSNVLGYLEALLPIIFYIRLAINKDKVVNNTVYNEVYPAIDQRDAQIKNYITSVYGENIPRVNNNMQYTNGFNPQQAQMQMQNRQMQNQQMQNQQMQMQGQPNNYQLTPDMIGMMSQNQQIMNPRPQMMGNQQMMGQNQQMVNNQQPQMNLNKPQMMNQGRQQMMNNQQPHMMSNPQGMNNQQPIGNRPQMMNQDNHQMMNQNRPQMMNQGQGNVNIAKNTNENDANETADDFDM